MPNTERRYRRQRPSAAHHGDEEQRDPPPRHEGPNLRSDVPLAPSALHYQHGSRRPASDVTPASPSYCLSGGETSRHGGQPSNFPAVPSIAQSPLRHPVHGSTQAINYLSDRLNSDIFESHEYQPASPRRHYQHNPSPVPGYRPPDLAPARNPEAHHSAIRRPMYTPMSGVGSNHVGTSGASENSSSLLGILQNRKAYSIRGESSRVYEPPLDWRYQLQRSPGEFFVLGRVFAILWHEGRGHQGTVISDFISQGKFTRGPFGEEIFSGIRRMVVVKAMSQCAWCVPITTYGGKGVAKLGVDPAKHAIVYMRGSVPACKPDEPRMTKEPLEVEPARPDERLDAMSRLNFGKVYTVEHNVKVRHVGMISSTSMVRFKAYASNEFRLENI